LKNYKRAFVLILAILVAILHFAIGPNYRGPFKDLLSGYLIDIILPFFLYFLFTIHLTQVKKKILVCLGILAFAAVIEYLQYRGTPIFGSIYDSYDLLAYFVGIISAILFDLTVLDKIIKKKHSA
jgi:hypothetical protein